MKLIIVIALLLIPFTVHAKTDWSVATVESTMKRYPTAKDLGSWCYAKSLYLWPVSRLQTHARSSLSQVHQGLGRHARRRSGRRPQRERTGRSA
jgi:hypothetical protein